MKNEFKKQIKDMMNEDYEGFIRALIEIEKENCFDEIFQNVSSYQVYVEYINGSDCHTLFDIARFQ